MKKTEKKTTDRPQAIRPPRKIEMSLRVIYTEKELLEIGKKLAEANKHLEAAESEKKGITSTLKAKCESIASRIQQHSGELTNGYTYRQIPCEVRYDNPSKGAKTTFRLDNGEIVETEAMTLAEMQIDLPLSGGSEINASGKIEKMPDSVRGVSADGVVQTEADDEDDFPRAN